MNFIGSKKRLFPFLFEGFQNIVGSDLSGIKFADLFSGTGIVSFKMMQKAQPETIIVNDSESFAYHLAMNRIGNYGDESVKTKGLEYLKAFNSTNPLVLPSGHYITRNFASERKYFTEDNAKKIDFFRKYMFREYHDEDMLFYYLMASLLEATDKIANVASVYEAYLKEYKKTALKPIKFREPLGFYQGNTKTDVSIHQRTVFDCLERMNSVDVIYLDPPYNHRNYASNYHVLNTVLNPDDPYLKGITGKNDYFKSPFNSKMKAHKAIYMAIEMASKKAKYVFVSYNDEGIVSEGDFVEMMKSLGKYNQFKVINQRYKADNNRKYKRRNTVEFLHCLTV